MSIDSGDEIRATRPEEADDVLRVLCAAFGLSFDAARPIFYQDPFFDLSHKRVLCTPGEGIVSCLTVIPSQIRVGDAWVPMGGIAGVATHPDRQRQGYAGRLLAATVLALADDLGYPLSGLFPYSYDYYRAFGWQISTQAACWKGPPSALPGHTEAACVRPVCVADVREIAAVQQLHAALTSGRTGACTRDARRWRIIDSSTPGRECVVYQVPGQAVTGYAYYERMSADDSLTLRVMEAHGATPEACRGLVGFFARHQGRAPGIEWWASADDFVRLGMTGAGASLTYGPGLMLRLTDLPAVLSAIHAANLSPVLRHTDRTLTIRAADPLRPVNQWPVRLTPVGVEFGTASDADWIAADVRALAQLYLGYRLPSNCAAEGKLQASSPAALALADQLFPLRAPYVAPLDQF